MPHSARGAPVPSGSGLRTRSNAKTVNQPLRLRSTASRLPASGHHAVLHHRRHGQRLCRPLLGRLTATGQRPGQRMSRNVVTLLASAVTLWTGMFWGVYWVPVRALADLGLAGAWGTLAITLAAAAAAVSLCSGEPAPARGGRSARAGFGRAGRRSLRSLLRRIPLWARRDHHPSVVPQPGVEHFNRPLRDGVADAAPARGCDRGRSRGTRADARRGRAGAIAAWARRMDVPRRRRPLVVFNDRHSDEIGYRSPLGGLRFRRWRDLRDAHPCSPARALAEARRSRHGESDRAGVGDRRSVVGRLHGRPDVGDRCDWTPRASRFS